jgi:hypothetical protein
LHTSGGHVIQFYSSFSSPTDILEYLKDKDIVDIFWAPSVNSNVYVPMILKASCVEMLAPIYGRAGLTVEKDSQGNLIMAQLKDGEELQQPTVGKFAKKRK